MFHRVILFGDLDLMMGNNLTYLIYNFELIDKYYERSQI